MIFDVEIRNFKSLADFKLRLEKFTCIVGLNGAGKSSILQAIDFITQLMHGDIDRWLDRRGWQVGDLTSKFNAGSNITLTVRYRLKDESYLRWMGTFNRTSRSCSREDIVHFRKDGSRISMLLRVGSQRYQLGEGDLQTVDFDYQGSILSILRSEVLPPEVQLFRDSLRKVRSLELLSPHLMRANARNSEVDIGVGGEKLAAYLYGIKGEQKAHLFNLLKNFYPQLVDFRVKQLTAGWKRLVVEEKYGEKTIETEAKHINDGLLRILAVLAQTDSDNSLLMLDEVENGINPEIVEKLVELLQDCAHQVIITTHSPMILNYLSDDVAEKSMQFVFRGQDGGTRVLPFFSNSRMKNKLSVMGPGEVFVDTDLTQLSEEFKRIDAEKQAVKAAKNNAAQKKLREKLTAAAQIDVEEGK